MATAVQAAPTTAPVAPAGDRLLPASLMAAGFILVGTIAAGFAVPKLLGEVLGTGLVGQFARMVVQVGAIAGLVWLGGRLAGENPPKGIRGGIFLCISTFFTVFFLFRAVGLNFTSGIGQAITAVVGLGLLFGAYKFLTSPRARGWMIALENMGWFHTFSYKRTQGLRLRRYTIMGLLIIGLSGVWTMMHQGTIAAGDLALRMPFLDGPVKVLSDKNFTIPLLLAAAILFLAWRAVNVPSFADFLIATEAEMNKVSWTPRKRLIQDTIVVLVFTLLLTAFLLVIDLFWGWLLSLNFIGVLPNKDALKQNAPPPLTQQLPW